MNRDHSDIRKQNGQWQPQQHSPYLQNSQYQRPPHPSASSSSNSPSLSGPNRSISPQPSSPVSPSSMHINTKPGGGSSSTSSLQRSNPSSPSAGSAANAMEIAARHYEALQKYLLAHILKEKHGVSEQRIAAREKLSRLLQNQLQDLSTDVYDELKRRTDGNQTPFLAVRDEFHPKRNQARQKLATLPQNRFKDLASDVYVQLERQFPSLLEMYPLQALEEKEYLSQPSQASQSQQQDRQDREPATPAVHQSSVVPNVATFTIQDGSSNEEEEAYYRSPGQQPPTPSALDGNVNFASLDSLMADLGNIVKKDDSNPTKVSNSNASNNKGSSSNDVLRLPAKTPEPQGPLSGLGINTGSQPNDQVQQEYEIRIQALCKRLQHLESDVGDAVNRPEGSRLAQVERQLAKQVELFNEQVSKVSKLQIDYNKVLNDYHAQLETVDMVNQEVKALITENKDLRQRQLDAEEELQLAYNRIKQLEDENSDLKADLEEADRNQKRTHDEPASRAITKESAPSTTAPITPTSANNVHVNDQLGNHTDQRLSMDERHNESSKNDWNNDRQQARDSIMVNPSSAVHKDSLDSFRNAVDDLLSAGRSETSASLLLGMKSVVIACKAVTEDVEDYEHEEPNDDGFVELKQELSSGLTQLMTAAKVHSNAFNEDEEEFERTLIDLETAADQLEAIVLDIVNVPKRDGSSRNAGHDAKGNSHHLADRDHRDTKQDHDSKHSGPNGDGGHGHNNDDEPMAAVELKIYLETQTVLIVNSIQTLLTSLRSASNSGDISDVSDNITMLVDQVIRQTRMTLATPAAIEGPHALELESQGEFVLEDLESSLDQLIAIKVQLENDSELAWSSSPDAKSVKQKMASASFDIAKYTKELVSLIKG
ncbi:hypothetical protein BC939DRAFT_439854 [Gamsiella multidivaricata]|uniref:uncharacterized protein n=1 Tax=Gamsiella multidivaricata TaxID=101098 RepID=UPI002220E9B4|nr:uncharacterized protein BC939DRAFT_439854 [Gamsiella multidivaricata]KAG0370049.1 component of the polarisome [Gamsiella multidivaricata]KAI7830203.1 hypothetical protein BC939DRAFT_439854 [Gamsiella multidivaricata]